jgi:acyl dehydratase
MTPHEFPVDIEARHFADCASGMVAECRPITVGEAAIVDFGRRFDLQAIHVDRQCAVSGPFGGVIASGQHTASPMMRLRVDHDRPRTAGLGSPGIDELRWPTPVRPGDPLPLRIAVTEARHSRTEPDHDLVRTFNGIIGPRAEIAMPLKAMTRVRCRCAVTPAAAT